MKWESLRIAIPNCEQHHASMPSNRKAAKRSARPRVADLNQEVANALGASTGTEVPKPKARTKSEKPEQARGPRPKSSR